MKLIERKLANVSLSLFMVQFNTSFKPDYSVTFSQSYIKLEVLPHKYLTI